MRARVKANYPWRRLTACAGAEFVKDEFRNVPLDREAEALDHPDLEIERAPVFEPVNATDSALALAAERGISLAGVVGSGAEGRIIKADVEKMVEARP